MKGLFWTLVLGGVFVLGLGYGSTLAGEEDQGREQVTISREAAAVEATLPTETVTVTRTVTRTVRGSGRGGAGRANSGSR